MFSIYKYSSRLLVIVSIIGVSIQCKQDDSPGQPTSQNPPPGNASPLDAWSIPMDEVISVLGVDGIPALTNPELVSLDDANGFLQDNELIVGFKSGDEVRAYPHQILDWHEIINDEVNGNSVAITYCPLTGTAIGWDRNINGTTVEYGVSGLLYNSNLIPYDRSTQSRYSQMLIQGVNGELIDENVTSFPVVETTWGKWKSMYPQTQVVSLNTGFVRSYGSYPYFINGHDYRKDPFLLFPIANDDTRLSRKERVLAVFVNDEAKAYPLSSFSNSEISMLTEILSGTNYVVVGSARLNFLVAFENQLDDGTFITLSTLEGMEPIILEDTEGNKWDIFGECVEGARKGQMLSSPKSYIGFWFAFGAFFPDIILD